MLSCIITAYNRIPSYARVAALCVAACLAGAAAMFATLERERIIGRYNDFFGAPPERPDVITSDWRAVETALATIERADVEFGNVDGNGSGGAIEDVFGHILYVSATGRIGAYNYTSGDIKYFDTRVPMDFDRHRKETFDAQDAFNQAWYRVSDALIVETAEAAADLYIYHHEFNADTQDMCAVVSRTQLILQDGALVPSGQWTTIYQVDPCMHLPSYDWNFSGHMTGGRMLMMDDETLLLSVGSFQMSGNFYQHDKNQMDAPTDYSKVLKIDLATGASSVYAGGVRNPQGLMIDSKGRMWETEHGPQGGDEVNLIVEGGDYGWPNVSHGMEYGAPRRNVPLNPVQGRHDGYIKPVYTFLPSVGVAQLIEIPGETAFKLWKDDLFVVSLIGETAFRMRLDGDRVMYAEPIDMGVRLRDVLRLENGWIAILTSNRTVILLRDPKADTADEHIAQLQVVGFKAVAALEEEGRQLAQDYSWPRDKYREQCISCHRLDGSTEVGPPLNGIIGRRVGSVDGYPYSPAMANSNKTWTKARLTRFLENPEKEWPGTAMSGVDLDKYERRAIVNYLAGLDD